MLHFGISLLYWLLDLPSVLLFVSVVRSVAKCCSLCIVQVAGVVLRVVGRKILRIGVDMDWYSVAAAVAPSIFEELTNNDSDVDTQRQQNTEMQKEFAQNGIRWKVADAKAAGLHPVFALGGSGASYTPNPITIGGGIDPSMGQNLSNAVARQSTSQERSIHNATMLTLEAQAERDFAQASYYRSEAARGIQGNGSGAPFPPVVGPLMPPAGVGLVTPKAPDVIAPRIGDASQTAAINPMWESHRAGDGVLIDLPRSDEGPAEAAENPLIWPAIVARNVSKYGSRWLGEMVTSPSTMDRSSQRLGDMVDWIRGLWGKLNPQRQELRGRGRARPGDYPLMRGNN